MTRNITHVHATKNSTELRNSVHVDPIVKFKVSKKSDWLIDRTTHFPGEYQKHTIGEEKTKLLSEISTKKLENFNDHWESGRSRWLNMSLNMRNFFYLSSKFKKRDLDL